MKNHLIIKRGKSYQFFSQLLFSIIVIYSIISLFLDSESSLKFFNNKTLISILILGLNFLLWNFLLSNKYIVAKYEKEIQRLINSITDKTFYKLRCAKLKDNFYYDTESKMICSIQSNDFRTIEVLVYSVDNVESIDMLVETTYENDTSKKSTSKYPYTIGGAMIGGLGGAITGSVIDSIFSGDDKRRKVIKAVVNIILKNGVSFHSGYGEISLDLDDNPSRKLNQELKDVTEIVQKINSEIQK